MRISDWSSDVCSSDLPAGKQFFIVPETGAGPDHPFSGEKLSVVMALYKARDLDEAIRLTNEIPAYQGQGHSCGIYSRRDENIMKLATATHTDRKRAGSEQSASVRADLGRPRDTTQKKKHKIPTNQQR